METKVIKQPDKISCVACVACMATNTRLIDFERFFFTKGPPYSDLDCYRYLLSKGYAIGLGFKNDKCHIIREEGRLRIEFKVKNFPAYVVVKSMRFKGMEHVVYWDGENILDPNPTLKEDGLPLKEYEIISWFPIIKFRVDGEIFLKSKEKNSGGKNEKSPIQNSQGERDLD